MSSTMSDSCFHTVVKLTNLQMSGGPPYGGGGMGGMGGGGKKGQYFHSTVRKRCP